MVDPKSTSQQFGSNITLSCQAKGYPPPNITWFHNNLGADLTAQASTTNGLSQLELVGISLADNGTYTCTASNEITPSVTSSAVLRVTGGKHHPFLCTSVR